MPKEFDPPDDRQWLVTQEEARQALAAEGFHQPEEPRCPWCGGWHNLIRCPARKKEGE